MTSEALDWFSHHPVTFWLTVLLAGDSMTGVVGVIVRHVRARVKARRR